THLDWRGACRGSLVGEIRPRQPDVVRACADADQQDQENNDPLPIYGIQQPLKNPTPDGHATLPPFAIPSSPLRILPRLDTHPHLCRCRLVADALRSEPCHASATISPNSAAVCSSSTVQWVPTCKR